MNCRESVIACKTLRAPWGVRPIPDFCEAKGCLRGSQDAVELVRDAAREFAGSLHFLRLK
jgi:hypothetical protein